MKFHFAAYSKSLGQVTDSDVTCQGDDVFGVRNSHLIFTDPIRLLGAYGLGTLITRLRFGNIGLSQYAQHHIYPLSITANVPSAPPVYDLREYPIDLPQAEEITLLASTSAVGPANVIAGLWLGTPNWNRNLPAGVARIKVRATFTTGAAAALNWGSLSTLTFERDLRAGVYAVVGANCIAAAHDFFRIRFPDMPAYNGKSCRPGGLCDQQVGNTPNRDMSLGIGEWGRFHTFNPPTIQLYNDTGAVSGELRLDVIYLGDNLGMLQVQ